MTPEQAAEIYASVAPNTQVDRAALMAIVSAAAREERSACAELARAAAARCRRNYDADVDRHGGDESAARELRSLEQLILGRR